MRKDARRSGQVPRIAVPRQPGATRTWLGPLALTATICLLVAGGLSAGQEAGEAKPERAAATLEETRLTLSKWIETRQTISKERKDWQQAKEVLAGRIELARKEVASFEEKVKQAETDRAAANKKREDLLAESARLKVVGDELAQVVTGLEAEVRQIHRVLPPPTQEKLKTLVLRMPDDPDNSKVAVAERFQNVVGIMNEASKASNEITQSTEYPEMGDAKREIQAFYVGLGQAYYLAGNGEAGIGRPKADGSGWEWQPSKAVARDVLTVLEILQGKQTAAFVPLPVKIQ